jgi:DNA-binding protein YbaB
MRQAQKMQEMMDAKQAELEERSFTAGAGGGMVEVTENGKKQLTSLVINQKSSIR